MSDFPSYRPGLDYDLYLSIKDIAEMNHPYQSSRNGSMPTSLVVFRLAESEGNVAIFDHMLNLPPHYTQAAISLAQTYRERQQNLLVKLKRIMK